MDKQLLAEITQLRSGLNRFDFNPSLDNLFREDHNLSRKRVFYDFSSIIKTVRGNVSYHIHPDHATYLGSHFYIYYR